MKKSTIVNTVVLLLVTGTGGFFGWICGRFHYIMTLTSGPMVDSEVPIDYTFEIIGVVLGTLFGYLGARFFTKQIGRMILEKQKKDNRSAGDLFFAGTFMGAGLGALCGLITEASLTIIHSRFIGPYAFGYETKSMIEFPIAGPIAGTVAGLVMGIICMIIYTVSLKAKRTEE